MFCTLLVDCAIFFSSFLVMIVMQTQVTIARESKNGRHHRPHGFERAGLFGFLYTSHRNTLDVFDLPFPGFDLLRQLDYSFVTC